MGRNIEIQRIAKAVYGGVVGLIRFSYCWKSEYEESRKTNDGEFDKLFLKYYTGCDVCLFLRCPKYDRRYDWYRNAVDPLSGATYRSHPALFAAHHWVSFFGDGLTY